jgi:hypothetical protein
VEEFSKSLERLMLGRLAHISDPTEQALEESGHLRGSMWISLCFGQLLIDEDG